MHKLFIPSALSFALCGMCSVVAQTPPPSQEAGDKQETRQVGNETVRLPIGDELRRLGVFINEKRLVPAQSEWNRGLVVKRDSSLGLVIASDGPKGIVVMTKKAHTAMLSGKMISASEGTDVVIAADTYEKTLERVAKISAGNYVLRIENRGEEPTEFRLQCFKARQPKTFTKEQLSWTQANELGELAFRLPREFVHIAIPRPDAMPKEIELAGWRTPQNDGTAKATLIAMSRPHTDSEKTMRQILVDTLAGAMDRMKIRVRTDFTLLSLGNEPMVVNRLDFVEKVSGTPTVGGAIFGIVHNGRIYTFTTIVSHGSVEEMRSRLSLCMALITPK